MAAGNYQVVIGLEVHVHLKTKTKLFCRCKNEFGAEPNTQICPVCTGQPGVLPVVNKKAVEQAVRAALALNCTINRREGTGEDTGTFDPVFARKQYFYPDLPKNYQISQYEKPLAENGYIELSNNKINITRAHMEEDAGKLIHEGDISLIDYNRTGTPLLEIVSEPEINSPEEAAEYLKIIRRILRYCGVSDCDMEKGSMRCDANISLKKKEDAELGVKSEVKNMNSFKAVEKALEYEADRQKKLLDDGGKIIQETMLWDEKREITVPMRSKEEAHDYRYFPEPDIPALVLEKGWIEEIEKTIPELPLKRKERYKGAPYCLSDYDAEVLSQEKEISDFFEESIKGLKSACPERIKKLTNWITVELMRKINAEAIGFSAQPIKPSYMAEMVELLYKGAISGKMAKGIFEIMWETKKSPSEIVEEKGMKQITSEDEIGEYCQKAIDDNPDIVEKYLKGKDGVIGPLVGSIMKETRGQANPKLVTEKLKELLKSNKNDK